VAAQRLIDRTHAEMAFLVRELDRRHLPELDEGLSTAGWLKRHTQMTAAQASGTVKTARVLGHMPTVIEAALDGAIPHRSLQLLAQARNRHKIEFVDHESVFGDIATYLSVADLRRGIERWEQQINFDQALKDTTKLETLRGFHHSQTYEGLWATKGTFAPEGGHIITQAINALCDPTNIDPTELRAPAQRRADAMVDICSFFLTHNTNIVTSGGEKPHVTITLDYEILKGQVDRLAEINGAPVTPETIRRITCDAGIIPMVLGSDSEPLDVGRKTRTIPTALRRALEQRDQGCVWQGCSAPVSWCDAHHIIHWANGGETNLTNTQLLCRTHHTTTHQEERSPPHY
ncbi:MAG: HNH endonuclease, partial [Actinomycetia bacterium]|nr:HNH endonuclease [Actinomycetes bacterium]